MPGRFRVGSLDLFDPALTELNRLPARAPLVACDSADAARRGALTRVQLPG